MQQTQNYQLNLIETDDTFSPQPLNENMEKLETAIAAEAAALDARIMVLEAKRVVVGTYVGDSNDQQIDLDFTPIAVIVHARTLSGDTALALWDSFTYSTYVDTPVVTIVEHGILLHGTHSARNDMVKNGVPYNFIAFA